MTRARDLFSSATLMDWTDGLSHRQTDSRSIIALDSKANIRFSSAFFKAEEDWFMFAEQI